MKLNKQLLRSIIKEVIEEDIIYPKGYTEDGFNIFKDDLAERNKTTIIDKDDYDKFIKSLKPFVKTDENIKRLEDGNVPYTTFTDMKGLNTYLTPLVGTVRTKTDISDIIAKQTENDEQLGDADEFYVGNTVFYKKGKGKPGSYIIVDRDGDTVTLMKTSPTKTIKTKANAVAKYEDALHEYDLKLNSIPDSEALSFL